MKQSIVGKKRKELENKMAQIFENNMNLLPVKLRKIMINDLVTAFESRICALNRAQGNLEFLAITDGGIQVETIKTRNVR